MSPKYPFEFDFSGYTEDELVREVRLSHQLDRDDLSSLVVELGKRLEKCINAK